MPAMPYYVYILESEKDGTYYVGATQNLNSRLHRHNQGRSAYTKTKRPWKLIYSETYPDRSSALKREMQIKNQKQRHYIQGLIENGPGVRTSRTIMREGHEFESRRPRHSQ
jgi:putative endonuclease